MTVQRSPCSNFQVQFHKSCANEICFLLLVSQFLTSVALGKASEVKLIEVV